MQAERNFEQKQAVTRAELYEAVSADWTGTGRGSPDLGGNWRWLAYPRTALYPTSSHCPRDWSDDACKGCQSQRNASHTHRTQMACHQCESGNALSGCWHEQKQLHTWCRGMVCLLCGCACEPSGGGGRETSCGTRSTQMVCPQCACVYVWSDRWMKQTVSRSLGTRRVSGQYAPACGT